MTLQISELPGNIEFRKHCFEVAVTLSSEPYNIDKIIEISNAYMEYLIKDSPQAKELLPKNGGSFSPKP